MNELERRSKGASASKGRSQTGRTGGAGGRSGAGSHSAASRKRGSRTSSDRNRSAGRTNAAAQARRNTGRRKRHGSDVPWMAIIGLVAAVVIICIIFAVKGKTDPTGSPEETAETELETEIVREVMVDGISITGMNKEAARAALLTNYPWSMKVQYGEESYDVPDMASIKVDELLNEIYSGTPEENYSLQFTGLEENIAQAAAEAAAKWNKSPKNAAITEYDSASDKFKVTRGEVGLEINEEKLASDIAAAISGKQFDAVITALAEETLPELTEAAAKEQYQTLTTFTTTTTANKKRNTNIRLSAEALNGTIVPAGAEFSFNESVGERTAEKGYQGAAAYNNGEVVEEIGGGVCQVSTTLYNAVVRAGLEISFRRSHTFEPSYVTPGQDATVSWGGPDFKFINTSKSAVGIRAHYADQKMTVSVYGIPILEDGVKYDLKSTKVKDKEPPAPAYEEDQTLEPGVEVEKKKATNGSTWETRLVITKNGEVISQEVDHNTNYKGHAAIIKRNTSGVVIPAETQPGESSSESGGESVADPSGTDGQAPSSPAESAAGPDASIEETEGSSENTPAPTEEKPAEEPGGEIGPQPTGESTGTIIAPHPASE